MNLSRLCEELFCKNGQIGYYLLSRHLAQQEEASTRGAVSASECRHSAQSGL